MRKTVLVFGASGFIGQKFCELYHEKYKLILVGGSRPGPWLKFDFLNPDFYALHDHMLKFDVPLDGIVFLQGLNPTVGANEINTQHYNDMLALNVSTPSLVIRELINKLCLNAAVSFISSVAAYKGSYDPAYAAAKSAIPGMINSLSSAWPSLRFNSVSLGLVENSPVHQGMSSNFEKKHLDAMGGTLVNVDDVCKTLDFLLECKSISRANIKLDCGYKL